MGRYLALLPVYLLAAALPFLSAVGANLEYEYALIASYAALALIPASALALPVKYIPTDGATYSPAFAFEIFWIFLISPVFGLAAGGWAFLMHLCPCSAPGFGFWMAVVWYPAWVLAHAVYHAVLAARVRGLPRWQIAATIAVAYLAITGVAAHTLWHEPQKRLVNLLTGFWHGPIYDDWIAVDGGLLLARGAHLAAAAMILVMTWYRRKVVVFASLLVLATVWIATGTLASNFHSVRNSKADLDGLLDARIEGEGFTMHYRRGTEAAPAAAAGRAVPLRIQRLYRDSQFHVGELTRILGGDGVPLPHVEIYVYPDEDRKKLWFGAGSTDVTDVHTPSIHITAGSWPHPTLRHELVHALASGFGYHGLGFHPNLAFTEGLAVALAPSPGTLSLDEGSASLLASGKLPKVEALFSPMFWSESGSRAYTVAGSLIRFLIEKHGIAGVKALYSGKSWEDAFGASRDALVKEWQDQVTTGYDKDKNALFAEAIYRYPGILHDVCPHSKADLNRSRNDSPFTRLRQPIGWDPDADYLGYLLRLDPHDKDARLRIWRREIRRIAQDRFPPQGRLTTWREALAHARAFPPEVIEDVEMGIAESDVARALGDADGSVKILEGLAAESEKHFFGDSVQRELIARLALEKAPSLPNPGAFEWRRYLANWRKIPETDVRQGPWLLSYLKLRNERDVRLDTGDLQRLLTELVPDPALPKTFAHEWYKLLANRLMRLGAFKDASTAFAKAAAAATPATREVFEEHARRATYYGTLGALNAAAADDEDKASH